MSDPWKEFRDVFNHEEPVEIKLPEWPAPIEYLTFEKQPLEAPRPLFENLLDAASRMIFGGGSKTYKTWAMSDMALSIAAGVPWWGFAAVLARALYVNFELKEYYMQRRLRAIRAAKKIELEPEQLTIWNLRGFEITLELFKQELLKLIRQYGIVIVFVDPFYKLLAGRDERVSAEINQILAAFDEINRLTGASIVFAAHFTKGNQAGKEAIDRISGGGSINRDPDNLVTLTKHETEHAFAVEFTLRDFAPVAPFVVRWDYPLLVRDDKLDPKEIKRVGPPMIYKTEDLLELIEQNDDELSTTDLLDKAKTELGWKDATFFRRLAELKKTKKIFLSKVTKNWSLSP
jgi:hypothetical protein